MKTDNHNGTVKVIPSQALATVLNGKIIGLNLSADCRYPFPEDRGNWKCVMVEFRKLGEFDELKSRCDALKDIVRKYKSIQDRYDHLFLVAEAFEHACQHACSGGTFFQSDHEKKVDCNAALESFQKFKTTL